MKIRNYLFTLLALLAANGQVQSDTVGKAASEAYPTELSPVTPWDQGKPIINGPSVYGASPGKDFRYLIPTCGERPVRFAADKLPTGLELDTERGIITGQAVNKGEYKVTLTAQNKLGITSKTMTIIIADNAMALTPPLGWNSWNCFRRDISDVKIRTIAQGMVSSGLAARGYSYVNMDSNWQSKKRGGKYNAIIPNEKFPDMKSLCDYIHGMGLKAGIYSGPYVQPCGTAGCGETAGLRDTNFGDVPTKIILEHYKYPENQKYADPNVGKYIGLIKYEREDVKQLAEWGFDYLKYDFLNMPGDMVLLDRMQKELRQSSRDIVFSSLCTPRRPEYARLANCWRASEDSFPTWKYVYKDGFERSTQEWNELIGPGCWIDLDMLDIKGGNNLTNNERIAYVSRWMIQPSPILISFDPAAMDDFTARLICNEELLAVNQDALGKPAVLLFKDETWQIYLKPLEDNSYAMGFFNLSSTPQEFPAKFYNLLLYHGITEKSYVRDLWAKKDLGKFSLDFRFGVASHCAKVFKFTNIQHR